MSGECEKCGEHCLDCKCYEKCKCYKHPATHPQEFDMLISEFGMMDNVLIQEIEATCKVCHDKFNFTQQDKDMISRYFNISA